MTIFRVLRYWKLPWKDMEPVREAVVRDYVHEILHREIDAGIDFSSEGFLDYDRPTTRAEWDAFFDNNGDFEVILSADAGRPIGRDHGDGDSNDSNDFPTRVPVIIRKWVPGEHYGDQYFVDKIQNQGLAMRSWNSHQADSTIAIGILPRIGVVMVGSNIPKRMGYWLFDVQSDRWRSFVCPWDCKLPEKLLRGPWVDKKLRFLRLIVESGACLMTNDQRNVAEQGLLDAIREDNYRAVDIIAVESIDARRSNDAYMEGTHVHPSFRDAEFDFGKGNGGATDNELRVNYLTRRITIGVRPSTEHLRAAVLERGCRKRIVRRLLFARSLIIDRRDPAIAKWIEERHREGDEKGSWLQYQLDRSERLQSLKKRDLRRELYSSTDAQTTFGDTSSEESEEEKGNRGGRGNRGGIGNRGRRGNRGGKGNRGGRGNRGGMGNRR